MKQYLDLLRDVMENGTDKGDRTGTGTRSVFGRQVRYDLAEGFPLLTTKKLHIRSILHELLWFLSGETNIRYLKENGVSIWDEWATPEGELGPVYGAQWRNWQGADGKTYDQILALVEGLKSNPDSRRHIINGWNVALLPDEKQKPWENAAAGRMALPPCHVLYQFYVANGKLSASLYIRSNDLFLGNPYNTASLAFLTHMLAQQCDLDVGEIVLSIGDAHIYSNHFDQVETQLQRTPGPLPKLKIHRKPASILDYRFEDFEIVDYVAQPHIKAPIAV
ncbi:MULTISPECIES: thymidylate synthase [unclassified Methylophaga]|jgi:thymidylate synthase|uniref:thymidylate synthase n=1 Tax=unclassified Methylophaga TaxID=2629249 RepID=UPI000C391891|nr:MULTISPECIES: thymidylate synthase [unclassified Methylophaga]MAL50069.1 thymidylate synthase [Methylophaga sp.]MAP27613.1 thymidylate synthase [Methylophaga sp.]MBP25374.1 thymidylate synthase [Methylophaga sp.]|tara:strand:+ start:6554 stop:7387 length:834 start_codon:yes stop_codon:yes gene_type:complete